MKQGDGWVGAVLLTDGREGNFVLVGPRQNPKGAVVVLPGNASGEVQTIPLGAALPLLHPGNVFEILCVQERAFGKSGLAAFPEPTESYEQTVRY
jgi:hypothetical protein